MRTVLILKSKTGWNGRPWQHGWNVSAFDDKGNMRTAFDVYPDLDDKQIATVCHRLDPRAMIVVAALTDADVDNASQRIYRDAPFTDVPFASDYETPEARNMCRSCYGAGCTSCLTHC